MRPTSLRSAPDLAADKPHGTRIRYMGGCRCVPCRAANSRYETGRLARRKAGESNGIVDAGRTRAHLEALSAAGVGRRTVSELAGVAESIVQAVKVGRRMHVRANTERAILAVTPAAAAPGALVSAAKTWRLVNRLLEEGYTRGFIAQAIGRQRAALQLNKRRITRRNALLIQRLYVRLMTTGLAKAS